MGVYSPDEAGLSGGGKPHGRRGGRGSGTGGRGRVSPWSCSPSRVTVFHVDGFRVGAGFLLTRRHRSNTPRGGCFPPCSATRQGQAAAPAETSKCARDPAQQWCLSAGIGVQTPSHQGIHMVRARTHVCACGCLCAWCVCMSMCVSVWCAWSGV